MLRHRIGLSSLLAGRHAAAAALRALPAWPALPGVLLMASAALAVLLVNSPFAAGHASLLAAPLGVQVGGFELVKPSLLWINDGLMAVFFLLVGLEIRRELARGGALANASQAALPVFAAVGGVAVPALVYAAVNAGDPAALRGWAIPAATDIAFALGVLALLGSRAPVVLKIFLTTVAVIDDVAAVLIIALFYSESLAAGPLVGAALVLAAMLGLNRLRVRSLAPYLGLGLVLWLLVLKSGMHATIAGVLTALTVPLAPGGDSPLHRLEHRLHPWVAFAILPVFAFANAGVPLSGAPGGGGVTLGIVLGLLVGKPVGVLLMSWVAIRTGVARMPQGVSPLHLVGVAFLTGIGFTMSLFVGALAFPAAQLDAVRVGVLAGSVLSAIAGYAALRAAWRLASRSVDAGGQPGPSSAPRSASASASGDRPSRADLAPRPERARRPASTRTARPRTAATRS